MINKKCNKKIVIKYIIIFTILITITNIIFIPWLKNGHMATDSYNIFQKGYVQYSEDNSLLDGRVFAAILNLITNYFEVSINIYSIITLEIALIVSCIIVCLLINTIEKYKKPKHIYSEIILIIACYYTIFNFCYIENLYFVECVVMSLSLLFYFLSAKALVEKCKYYKVKLILFMLLGIFAYQGTISMFFLMIMLLSMCKNNNIKEIGKNLLTGVIVLLIGVACNQLFIKIIEEIFQKTQSRDFDIVTTLFNILIIICYIPSVIKNTGYCFFKYGYILMLSIYGVLVIFKLICNKENINSEDILIKQVILVIVSILVAFIPSVISTSAFESARLRYSLGAGIGTCIIHLWVKTNFSEEKGIINILLISYIILYGFITSINYVFVMIEVNKVNKYDEELVSIMEELVEDYEKVNNINVEKIAIVTDKYYTIKAFYSNIKYLGSIMMPSAIKTEWSAVGCYNYYSKENLEIYIPTEEEENYFLDKNEDYLCIGDTLYIAIYMY